STLPPPSSTLFTYTTLFRSLARDSFTLALQRLDLLLYRQILRLRASYQLSLDEFRGLYVSDQQVDALIQQDSRFGQVDVAELDRSEEHTSELQSRENLVCRL